MQELMTQAEYAEHRKVSAPMISKYIKQGKITKQAITFVTERGKKYKRVIVEQADIDLKNNLDPAQTTSRKQTQKKPDISINDLDELSFEQARTRKEIIKSELNKIKLEIEQGKYIEAEQVSADWFKAGRTIRNSLEQVGIRVAALVASESDRFKCQMIIEKEVKHILNDLVSELKNEL